MKKEMYYPALKWLIQWNRNEKALYEGIKDAQEDDLFRKTKSAMAYFQVARTFAGVGGNDDKDKKKEKFYRAIAEEAKAINSKNPDHGFNHVNKLEEAMKKQLASVTGNKNQPSLMSAASKLLWLVGRQVPIFDANARKALGLGNGVTYKDFFKKWNKKYKEKENAISDACSALKKAKQVRRFFDPTWHIEDSDFEQEWFKKRVLDMYLWEEGNS